MTGARSNTSDVTLDGVPNTAIGNPGQVTASYVPPVDAVSEFKVQTAACDVKVGQTAGGVVNISLKSGTNALHGAGYCTKMAPWMTATDFFANQTGWSRVTPLIPTSDSGLTFRAKLDNPFPDGILEPVGNGLGIETELGNSITFFNTKPLAPYMQRWQLGIQHELPHRIVVEINYVGSRGMKLETTASTRDLNAIPQRYLSKSMVRDQPTIDYLSANLPNPFNPLISGTIGQNTTISRANLLRAYPHFNNGMRSQDNNGSSWYHGMQARVDKRFSAGLALHSAFTWSKVIMISGRTCRWRRTLRRGDRASVCP